MTQTTEIQRIIQQHQKGEITEAIEQYKTILKSDEKNGQAHELIGIAYAQSEQLETALKHFQKALKLNKHQISAGNNLATCYKRLGHYKKAKATYKKLLKVQPENPALLNNYANILMHEQQHLEARSQLEAAIALKPDYSDAYFNLGLLSLQTNEPEESLAHFISAHKFGHLTAAYQIAQHYEQHSQLTMATQYYQHCTQAQPNHALAHHGLARSLLAQKKDIDALEHFIKAQKIDPTIPHLMENIASYYHVKGMFANAIEYWSKTPITDTNKLDVMYNIAVSFHFSGRHEEALERFYDILKTYPEHMQTHMNVAAIALQNCQYKHAINHYQEALKQDPDNLEILFILSALKREEHKDAAPKAYVENLFDQYAGHYDSHLLNMLRYRAPKEIELILNETLGKQPDLRILDIGCGTGIMGPILQPYAKELIGIDLSENMLLKAREKNHYTELHQIDCHEYLEKDHTYDLIIAAELLPYIGRISKLLKLIANRLDHSGFLIISIERTQEDGFVLSESARFKHNPAWVESEAKTVGLILKEDHPLTLRLHQAKAVDGNIMVFTKSTA